MDRAAAVGVVAVVTVGDDLSSAQWAATAAGWHPSLYAAVAVHPTRADTLDDKARAVMQGLAGQPRVVAVGETGLDHYWDAAPHDVQREAFAWHIELAKQVGKPLMIHDRDAHDAVFDVLAAEGAPDSVIFHCFSGNSEMARACADRGWVMSFAGAVSFRNARDLAEAARIVPADLLMAETDAPFLTPHPHRGARNEPYALPYTVRALAELRGVPVADLCRRLTPPPPACTASRSADPRNPGAHPDCVERGGGPSRPARSITSVAARRRRAQSTAGQHRRPGRPGGQASGISGWRWASSEKGCELHPHRRHRCPAGCPSTRSPLPEYRMEPAASGLTTWSSGVGVGYGRRQTGSPRGADIGDSSQFVILRLLCRAQLVIVP